MTLAAKVCVAVLEQAFVLARDRTSVGNSRSGCRDARAGSSEYGLFGKRRVFYEHPLTHEDRSMNRTFLTALCVAAMTAGGAAQAQQSKMSFFLAANSGKGGDLGGLQ